MNRRPIYRYTALIIDEDAEYRNILKKNLQNRLFGVFQTDDHEEGISILRKEVIDFMIVDPSGLTKEQNSPAYSDRIPLVISCRNEDIEKAAFFLNNAACALILKPISEPDAIDSAIDRCVKLIQQNKQRTLYTKHLEQEIIRKTKEIDNKNLQLKMFNENLKRILDSTFSNDASMRKLDNIGTELLNGFSIHLQASGGSIYITEGKGLRRVHSLENEHAPEFLPFPLKENSPFNKVLKTRKPILIDNIEMASGIATSGWSGYKDSSFIIFPLPDHNGKITGLLSLHNKIAPPFLSEDKEMGILMSAFYKEVNRAVSSIESLYLSESKYQLITDNSAAVIFSYSIEQNRFDFINPAILSISGYSRDSIISKDIRNFVTILDIVEKEDVISHFENMITGRSSGSGLEYRIKTSSGQLKWIYQQTVTIYNAEGFPVSVDGILTEFSDQKENEDRLRTLVEQKDVLLNEINHRVKNNLQIISSLINLQSGFEKKDDVLRALENINNRINSIALIHDNIYDTELMSSVNIKNYLEKLVTNLCEVYLYTDCIETDIDIADIDLDLDRAVLCGLIINEALSNIFNHAFQNKPDGIITLTFNTSEKNYIVHVIDNGIGFDPKRINRTKNKGLGLDIMQSLIIQLDGSIDIVNNNGSDVIIKFPVINSKMRKDLL